MKATIKLFKALPVQSGKTSYTKDGLSLLRATVPRGFIYSPEVIANYSEQELLKIAEDIGRTPEQLNSAFHKSWKKVRDTSIIQLWVEQVIHYITTYGFKNLGIYDKDSVYIPNEQLDVPKVTTDICLVVIKGYTKDELKEKVLKMLSSGVALKEDTLNYIVEVCTFVGITLGELERVKNKEVRIKLYDYLDILPEDPTEFLRFLLYRTINETLLIKSKETVKKILEEKNKVPALLLFAKYEERYGLRNLAKIFNRFKPLFLAFKSKGQTQTTRIDSIINKVSRLSKRYHEPMKVDYLNEITSMIKKRKSISLDELKYELGNVNTFRKIRLAYALKYRTKDVTSILYKIRNGKSWATETNFNGYVRARSKAVLSVVVESIINDVSKKVSYKKVYIPSNVEYALPATEKQFTGNFPSGTYVTVDKDMVFGIHWFNHLGLESEYDSTVDLDLALLSADGKKYGWDGFYRTDERNILFSGDVTDAPRPKGASELFYLAEGESLESPVLMTVNYYNYSPQEVPFEIIVGKHCPMKFGNNYVIDPNDIVCSTESKMDSKQKILGIVAPTPEGIRFYFSESSIGSSITVSDSPMMENSRRYLVDFNMNTLSLNEILRQAGAKIVENEEDCDINLSLEKIEKDTILNLLS